MDYTKAEFLTSYGLSSQIPESDRIEIAFAGRSNVGKSSTINKLFNRKALARVSCVPGKTATINFYKSEDIHFVDLPGYGYAKVAKTEMKRWSELIEGYFAQDRNLQLVVSLIDMRHKPSDLDIDMVEFLVGHSIPFIIVMTKSDKLNKTQTAERMSKIKSELPYGEDITVIPFSSETGEGVDAVRAIIDRVIEDAFEAQAMDEEMEEQNVNQSLDMSEESHKTEEDQCL